MNINKSLKKGEKLMRKKLLSVISILTLTTALFTGCGSSSNQSGAESNSTGTQAESKSEKVVLKGLADLVPHNELIEFVKPQLEEQGIEIDIQSTASDDTWNSKVEDGDVDFNFNQHVPYLEEWNEINGGHLVSAGVVHVEPIAAYSEKYNSVEEVPDDATVIIPNDATNEYRALSILEKAGFIKLRKDLPDLRASVADIEEYIKPIKITEIDSYQIIGHSSEFDIYIVNTNKAIEAGIDTTKYLFREDGNSPYANVIVVKEDKKDDPAIKALVKALQSEETRKFIEEKYNGAVIPAELK